MSNYRRVPWKRNLIKIPENISSSLSGIPSELVVVAATKKIGLEDVNNGLYSHLGIKRDAHGVTAPATSTPLSAMGKFSERNREGWEVKRDDLPKIVKTYSWETPNFGDASTYGTHMHFQDREVYQREYHQPRHLSIGVEILRAPEGATGQALVKFGVECILDRTRSDFEEELLLCLNLLQENVGAVGVYASDATREDFIGTIALDWEVFPPGTAAEVIAAFSTGRRTISSRANGQLESRLKLFSSLKPKSYLRGTGSFDSYVGAQFADDLVVFENLTYGNALYILYDGWESISKRSRLDLLKGTIQNFDRFLHTDGWEDRFKEHIGQELQKRKDRKQKALI